MVCAFPWSRLIRLGYYLHPLLCSPIKHVKRVESSLVCSTTPENHYALIDCIIAHGAIRAKGGDIPGREHFSPLHGNCIETPYVIHVARV